MSTSTRMDEAHSLVSMNRNYRREEIKDRIRTGKACSNVKSNMDLASVTPEDIDALPWDDEDMTVKRCLLFGIYCSYLSVYETMFLLCEG